MGREVPKEPKSCYLNRMNGGGKSHDRSRRGHSRQGTASAKARRQVLLSESEE